MGVVEEGWGGWAPAPGGAPLYIQKDDHWTHFDNSVNAVSFGFVATAILISMFLVMAIFEKFLRTTSPPDSRRRHSDLESQSHIVAFNSKLRFPSSPKVSKCKCKRSIGGDAGQQGPDLYRTSCSGALPTGASAVAATSSIRMGSHHGCTFYYHCFFVKWDHSFCTNLSTLISFPAVATWKHIISMASLYVLYYAHSHTSLQF
ncbi:hypothetical protein SASPL_121281 [Salvia splendens]|uniref:Uncharacterized protein n=1 Tax=Salvia splendens TaxID=180675 RepID=A0A8X8ZUM3_SALSN|nr:hypothetical protein SASPL_121281 [Salvia splendens]